MADNNTTARPYAQAAFDLASERQELANWSEALSDAKDVLADGQVEKFLANPSMTDVQKLKFLAGLFNSVSGKASLFAGGNKHGTNFLKLLLEYNRVSVLPEIAAHFLAFKAKVENSVDATVTSATKLGAEQLQEIATALKKRLGRDVKIETKVDENLIGGAVIRAGDVVIDGSLRARLEGLAAAMIK